MALAGCDLGIASAKVVILEMGKVAATAVLPYTCLPQPAASDAFNRALQQAGLTSTDVQYGIATGFGKNAVAGANESAPETVCLSRAVGGLTAGIRTVIDVGASSFTAYALDPNGKIIDTTLHDRCAAGTGLYIDLMCRALQTPCDALTAGAMHATHPVRISSQCAILAESDVISALNEGKDRYDIFAGVADSVARKISALARQVSVVEKVLLIGGVSRNPIISLNLETRFGLKLADPGLDTRAFMAYGAALLAGDRLAYGQSNPENDSMRKTGR